MTTARPPAGQGKPTEEMKRAMRIALNMPEASIMKLPQAQRDILLGFREAHAKRETALYRAKRANRQVMRPGTRLKIKWLTYLLMGALTIFLCFAAHAGAVAAAEQHGWPLTLAGTGCGLAALVAAKTAMRSWWRGGRRGGPPDATETATPRGDGETVVAKKARRRKREKVASSDAKDDN